MDGDTCIRRGHSYWTSCNCDPCRLDNARKYKLRRLGRPYRVPDSVAWDELAARFAQGWTVRAVGSATGLDPRYFLRHAVAWRRGARRPHLGPAAAAAIMNMGVPTEGQVGAEPSRRRLRALAAMGYGLRPLAVESGIDYAALASIRGARTKRVGAKVALDIAATYDRLNAVPGGDAQAARLAREKQWPSPWAWNDIDHDPHPIGYDRAGETRSTTVDPVVVDRILSGDFTLAADTNRLEKLEVLARWTGSDKALEEKTRWNVARLRRDPRMKEAS